MHHSKLPLTIWFWAAYLMATHSNGISALQLQRQLGFGSYKTAWLICAKLRRSMVAPDRNPLAGLVEVDETGIACRSKYDPPTGGGGRSIKVKCWSSAPSRSSTVAPDPAASGSRGADYSADSLHPFIAQNLAIGTTAKTDGGRVIPVPPVSDTIPV